jgi:sugar lactone lactonase YvrE
VFKSILKQPTNLVQHAAFLLFFFLTATTVHSQDLTINSSKVATIDLQTTDGLLIGEVEKAIIDEQRRVFIVDNGNKQVHYFDPNGQYVRSMGREGRGPGEFMRAVGATLSHDGKTFYVLDSPNARIVSYEISNGDQSEMTPLQGAAPTYGNDMIDFDGKLIFLGNYFTKDAMLHVIDQNGEVSNSFGNFIDFSSFTHNSNGKSQLSVVSASHYNNKLLVTLMAPNRVKLYDSDLNLINEFEDDLLPKPWETHMIMRPDRYRTTPYSQTVNSQIISDNLYLYQWLEIIDADEIETEMHIELRDLRNGDILARYDIPDNKSVLNFARIDDQSVYILMRNESYDFEIYKLSF